MIFLKSHKQPFVCEQIKFLKNLYSFDFQLFMLIGTDIILNKEPKPRP